MHGRRHGPYPETQHSGRATDVRRRKLLGEAVVTGEQGERSGPDDQQSAEEQRAFAEPRQQDTEGGQYAGSQAELGWTAAQTYQQISGHRPGQLGDQVYKVGAQHFSRQHVANAGRAYRQANPDDRLVGNVTLPQRLY